MVFEPPDRNPALRKLRDAAVAEPYRQKFNEDKTRYIVRGLLGWTCYAGSVDVAGDFTGRKLGVIIDRVDAERWLAGEDVPIEKTPGSEDFDPNV